MPAYVKDILSSLTIAIAVILFTHFLYGFCLVNGDSMNNTLKDSDILLAQKYNLDNSIDRFDIVFFSYQSTDGNQYDFIKRVIGLPGETVQIIDGEIYINDVLLEDMYKKEAMKYGGTASHKITLAVDEYFVLGDNRNNSLDSRFEEVGLVKQSNINAIAIFRLLPWSKFL